jgi:hypothetical protein
MEKSGTVIGRMARVGAWIESIGVWRKVKESYALLRAI